jgi:hypothetical protein
VTYPGFTPVGNATLAVANVLTCNKHSHKLLCEGPVLPVCQPSISAFLCRNLGMQCSVCMFVSCVLSTAAMIVPHSSCGFAAVFCRNISVSASQLCHHDQS